MDKEKLIDSLKKMSSGLASWENMCNYFQSLDKQDPRGGCESCPLYFAMNCDSIQHIDVVGLLDDIEAGLKEIEK